MKMFLRIAGSAGLCAVFWFCLLGFIATFEPLPPSAQWTWRSFYGAAALLGVAGLWLLWRPRSP